MNEDALDGDGALICNGEENRGLSEKSQFLECEVRFCNFNLC